MIKFSALFQHITGANEEMMMKKKLSRYCKNVKLIRSLLRNRKKLCRLIRRYIK